MIFCAAGDPGGSRALLPVIEELERNGVFCAVLENGFLARELPQSLHNRLCPASFANIRITESSVFLFSSSVSDALPLTLARFAREVGLPVIHVLDNWSSYKSRLCTDGLVPLIPDVYTVMDKEAEADAIAEGIPASCLMVTGHPGMSLVATELKKIVAWKGRRSTARQLGYPENKVHLAFINEPFRAALGADTARQHHPGFTEDQILAAFLDAIAPYKERVYITLLPHPKDSLGAVEKLWDRLRGEVEGTVLSLPQGRDILGGVDGVAGMASILLYEAWLAGLPVLALQPGCKIASMRRYSALKGVEYAGRWETIGSATGTWLTHCKTGSTPKLRPEVALHAAAPERIAEIVMKRCKL
jgi:hypothetical protein